MASNTPASQRNGKPYQLFVLAEDYCNTQVLYFDTLEELARAAYYQRCVNRDVCSPFYRSGYPEHWMRAHVQASSFRGAVLDIVDLCKWGAKLARTWYIRPLQGYTRRQGPVPGVRKWRGGYSYTHCRVQSERRLNAGWLPEEGEPGPRPCRTGFALYDSWDGRNRHHEACWKSQHKGSKSWDRR